MGPNWISFVYTNGSNWNLPEFMSTLKQVVPNNSMLNIIATGTQQWPVLAMALIHGFNIRVGMEDGVYLEKGRKADSNAQLVEKAVGLAKMVGRPVATCAEARAMLGLGAPRQYTGK
jgi:3-keto-5-aminohexanoate cleavage enzyme